MGCVCFAMRGQDVRMLLASGVFLAAMLASSASAVYSDVLLASDPTNSLTVANATEPTYGLTVGLDV